MRAPGVQSYPRIPESEKLAGLLDERHLVQHRHRISQEKLRKIIVDAIRNANRKSARAILEIPEKTSDAEMRKIFLREGRNLFDYFQKYCGDPAASAFEYRGKTYREVAVQQFRIRTLQKERMNSAWRYQLIAYQCAALINENRPAADMDELYSTSSNSELLDYLQESTGYGREEIMMMICDASADESEAIAWSCEPIDTLIEEFGDECRKHGLLDNNGRFNDPRKLIHLFCNG